VPPTSTRAKPSPTSPSSQRRNAALLIAAVVAIAAGLWLIALRPHPSTSDPGAGGGSANEVRQRALGALSAAVAAKDKACGPMTGSDFATCMSQLSVLTNQYNTLVLCLGGATTIEMVTACEDRVGVEH
jgi:hypothetical protein